MLDVAAAITTCGVFDCVAMRRGGQRGRRTPKPASTLTLSLTISSCARRLVTSGVRGVVLDDQLDLLAGHGVAVLRHVEPRGRFDLAAGGGLLAGHRQDQADLERVVLCVREREGPARCAVRLAAWTRWRRSMKVLLVEMDAVNGGYCDTNASSRGVGKPPSASSRAEDVLRDQQMAARSSRKACEGSWTVGPPGRIDGDRADRARYAGADSLA